MGVVGKRKRLVAIDHRGHREHRERKVDLHQQGLVIREKVFEVI